MTLNSPLLSARLSVEYTNGRSVLRNVAFEISTGEILGLVGGSGSGKSTIALALLNMLQGKGGKISGEVVFQGEDLLKKKERQLRQIRGRTMSIVLQSPLTSLNPALHIGAQLKEAWRAHAKGATAECDSAIKSALASVSLPSDNDFLNRRPSQLSVGQGQRVIIAMAILHRPALLISDEATSALDPITQYEILDLFRQLNRELGTAILYISHDLLSVAALCDRVAILNEGQIMECAASEQIFDSPGHPYTRRLVDALPKRPDAKRTQHSKCQ